MNSTSSDGDDKVSDEPKQGLQGTPKGVTSNEGTPKEDNAKGTPKRKAETEGPEELLPVAQKPRIDPDEMRRLLECPVCLMLPSGMIFMCWESHFICEKCYDSLELKYEGNMRCPLGKCGYPKDRRLRMRNTEQLIELCGFEFPCANEEHGCKVMSAKKELPVHAKQCGFRLMDCYVCKTKISRNQMAAHYETAHRAKVHSSSKCDIIFNPSKKYIYSTWSPRFMTAVIGEDILPFYYFLVLNSKHGVIAVMADLEDPRFQGVECTIELEIPEMGTWSYRGPLYDLETSYTKILAEPKGGIYIPTELIEKNSRFWPKNGLFAKFNLIKK